MDAIFFITQQTEANCRIIPPGLCAVPIVQTDDATDWKQLSVGRNRPLKQVFGFRHKILETGFISCSFFNSGDAQFNGFQICGG